VRLAKGEEYGVRLAMSLALAGRQLTVPEIAEREGLPEPTVAKVLSELRKGGVVAAERGRQGGYELARPAEQTSVLAILRAMDGPLFEGSFCRHDEADLADCVHDGDCGLLPVWLQLEQLIEGFLAGISLADVAAGRLAGRQAPASVLAAPPRSGGGLPAGVALSGRRRT